MAWLLVKPLGRNLMADLMVESFMTLHLIRPRFGREMLLIVSILIFRSIFSLNKKAFSLMEAMVVTGLIGLVLALFLYLRSGSASADHKLTGLEEYFNQKSRLEALLRQDLRNATAIVPEKDGSYRLKTLVFDPKSGKLIEQIVGYRLGGPRRQKIERVEGGKNVQTFDFSRFAAERKVKLEISSFK